MKKAFTLIELLVVVIVLGILAKLAVPKMVRVLETRRTTEAEEVLSAVRTEQEKRCVAGNFYTTDFSKMPSVAYLDKANKGNYDYRIADDSNPDAAVPYPYVAASRKGYTLRMYYKTGHLCCDGAEACEKLNKKYPSCSELAEDYATGDECIDTVGAIENCVDRPGFCCSKDPDTLISRNESFVWSADHGKCVECDRQKKDPSFCPNDGDHIISPKVDCDCITCKAEDGLTFNKKKNGCMCRTDIEKKEGYILVDNSKDETNPFCKYLSCDEIAAKGGLGDGFTLKNGVCDKPCGSPTAEYCHSQTPPEKWEDWSYFNKSYRIGETNVSFKKHSCSCESCPSSSETGEYRILSGNSCVCDDTKVSVEKCKTTDGKGYYDSRNCKCRDCRDTHGANYKPVSYGTDCVCDTTLVNAEICRAQEGNNKWFQDCECVPCSKRKLPNGYSTTKHQYVDSLDEAGNWTGCVLQCINTEPAEGCGEGKKWDADKCSCVCSNKTSCGNREKWDESSCSCVEKECNKSQSYCENNNLPKPDFNEETCECECNTTISDCKATHTWFDADHCACKTCEEAGQGYSGETYTGDWTGCTTTCRFDPVNHCFAAGKVLLNPGAANCECVTCEEWYKETNDGRTYSGDVTLMPNSSGLTCSACGRAY